MINAQHELMLLTGAADRVVRVFKPDLAQFQTHKLVTAFTAFGYSEKKNSKKEAGLIVEWDEANEILMCAGDTETIRVWDMNKELYKDYPTQQNSCVSCLSTHDNFTVAGFGDGTIKLFDFRRASPVNLRNDSFSFNGSMPLMNTSRQLSSSSYEKFEHIPQHRAYVHSVKIHKPSYTLVSASILGDFNVYDLRNQQKVFRSQLAKSTDETSAFECHPFNQLIAIANNQPVIKVYDFNGNDLATIKHHEGFLGKRIAPVKCLDWNFYKNDIVFGGKDNCLSIFSCKENAYN